MINGGTFSIPIFLLLLTPYVYARGPRLDYDEAFQDIEGATECWVDGYDAGFAGVYDRERAEECNEIPGDQYNASWKYGCDDGGYGEYIKKYSDVRIDHDILENANRGECWMDIKQDRKMTHTTLKDLALATSTVASINMVLCLHVKNQQARKYANHIYKETSFTSTS